MKNIDYNFDFGFPSEDNSLIELFTGSNLLEISKEIKKGWIEVKEQVIQVSCYPSC